MSVDQMASLAALSCEPSFDICIGGPAAGPGAWVVKRDADFWLWLTHLADGRIKRGVSSLADLAVVRAMAASAEAML